MRHGSDWRLSRRPVERERIVVLKEKREKRIVVSKDLIGLVISESMSPI